MLDNYSVETNIANLLYQYLINKDFTIIQLVTPGGQATYSIRYTSLESCKKKIIFPDLIALSEKIVLVGEIKPTFSQADERKLIGFAKSIDGEVNLKALAERICKQDLRQHKISLLLIHGGHKKHIESDIPQLILTEKGALFIES